MFTGLNLVAQSIPGYGAEWIGGMKYNVSYELRLTVPQPIQCPEGTAPHYYMEGPQVVSGGRTHPDRFYPGRIWIECKKQ